MSAPRFLVRLGGAGAVAALYLRTDGMSRGWTPDRARATSFSRDQAMHHAALAPGSKGGNFHLEEDHVDGRPRPCAG